MATKRKADPRQAAFGLFEQPVEATLEPYSAPVLQKRAPGAYDPWPPERDLAPGDHVTLIYRTGRVKTVMFNDLVGPRVSVTWPLSNDTLEVSLKTGQVANPRALRDWYLEPGALAAARRQHAKKKAANDAPVG